MSPAFAYIDSFPNNTSASFLMKARNCPVCGGDADTPVVQFPNFQFFTDSARLPKRTDIHQVRCTRCQALYMNPCYSTEGFGILFAQAGMTYGATEMRKQEQLDWLAARGLLQPGSLLMDVGCYRGDFISTLPPEVEAVGVDIDPGIIDIARATHGAPNRRFLAADFTGFSFDDKVDTFTMFHVLEHLPEPRKVLGQLRRIAGPTTRLVVEVPLLEKAHTNDINGYLTISHLTHFSLRTLEICLAAEGWRIIDRTDQPDYNGYRILAVPAEADTSLPGNPLDTETLEAYLKHWNGQCKAAEKRLAGVPADRDCVLWGAGFHTELIYNLTPFFKEHPKRRYLLVDSDPTKHNQTWRGISIVDSKVLGNLDWSDTSLLLSSYGSQEMMQGLALDWGVPAMQIYRIYDHIRRY